MHGCEAIVGEVWEDVAKMGAEGQLLGIVARPSQGAVDRPFVMFLNAGVLHRVGPHRIHVSLARRLAQQGLTSLRLDLGGIGDSPATGHAGTFMESAVADIRGVMTELERSHGARRFVLFGLCSGADNGLAAALQDERIVGLVLLDPHSYPTRRSQLRKISKRAIALGSARAVATWGMALVARRVRARLAARAVRHRGDAAETSGGREPPPQETMRANLHTLVDRGVKILAIYSGAYGDRYNHRDQVFELFPELRGRIDHEYFPAANHMFTELTAQAALMSRVTTWVTRHFA
jgi:alpha-beta hydrolase superfamily lysophospholipase